MRTMDLADVLKELRSHARELDRVLTARIDSGEFVPADAELGQIATNIKDVFIGLEAAGAIKPSAAYRKPAEG